MNDDEPLVPCLLLEAFAAGRAYERARVAEWLREHPQAWLKPLRDVLGDAANRIERGDHNTDDQP